MIEASVERGPTARVIVDTVNGPVEVIVYVSQLYSGVVTVEIDGDFTRDTAVRINMNDQLIWDTDQRTDAIANDTRKRDL